MRVRFTALIIAALLVGCSKPAQPTSETSAETTATTTAQVTAAEATTAQTTAETSAEKIVTSDAEEYSDALRAAFRKYADNVSIPLELTEKGDYDGAKEALEVSYAALREFDNITPPAEYSGQHEKLMASIDSEFKSLDLTGRLISVSERFSYLEQHENELSADDKQEVIELVKEIDEINESMNASSEFADTFMETIKMLKADTDG